MTLTCFGWINKNTVDQKKKEQIRSYDDQTGSSEVKGVRFGKSKTKFCLRICIRACGVGRKLIYLEVNHCSSAATPDVLGVKQSITVM